MKNLLDKVLCQKHANQQQASVHHSRSAVGWCIFSCWCRLRFFGLGKVTPQMFPFVFKRSQRWDPFTANFDLAHFKRSTIELKTMHYHGMLTVNSKHHSRFALCLVDCWWCFRYAPLSKDSPHSSPCSFKILQRKGLELRVCLDLPATHFNLVQFKKSKIELKTRHYHGMLTVWYSMWSRSLCNQF